MRKEDNTPALRFPGFNDKWKYNTLGNLLEFKNGINAKKEQYGKGVKFINVLDVLENDYITYDKIIGSVDVDEKTIDKNAVRYGDILFQRSSETREEVGSASVYLDKEKIATFGGFVIRGKKIADYVPEFFNKLLKTDTARDSITSRSGGSTRFNVGQETLSTVNLAFPSLSEQFKIASFLIKVDEKLTQLKRKNSLLVKYKKCVMQKIFSQEIRFKDEIGEEFPEWEEKSLGTLCDIRTGKKDLINKIDKGKYPFFVRSANIERIDTYSYNGEAILIPGDGKIGEIFHYINGKFDYHQRVYKISDPHGIFLKYLYYYLSKFFYQHAMNFTVKATVDSLRLPVIRSFVVKIPCIKEQEEIANFLSILDDKINQCSIQMEKSEQWKKGLLQKMFC